MRNRLVLFSVAAFLLTGTNNLQAQSSNGEKRECIRPVQCETTTTERAEAVALRLTETLKLEKEQTEKVEAIYLKFFNEQGANFKGNEKSEKPRRGKKGKKGGNKGKMKNRDGECLTRHKALESELSKVLTPEQMTEYTKVMEGRKSKKGNRQGKPGGRK